MKKIAAISDGELNQVRQMILTRAETKAEADLLFGGQAKDMRQQDRSLLNKLFVQAPGAQTMAPNLQYDSVEAATKHLIEKRASAQKTASPKIRRWTIAPGTHGTASPQFTSGTEPPDPTVESASSPDFVEKRAHKDQIPGGLADHKKPSDFRGSSLKAGERVESEHTSNKGIAEEITMDHLTEDPHYYEKLKKMEKKAFASELSTKSPSWENSESGTKTDNEEFEDKLLPKAKKLADAMKAGAVKTASVAANTEAFFEKKAYLTDAQKRYPELLKVANGRTADPGRPALDLKKKSAGGALSAGGPVPTQSSLSGGSA